MRMGKLKEEDVAAVSAKKSTAGMSETSLPPSEDRGIRTTTITGVKLWILIGGMYLGVYLVGMDMTMMSTVVPTLTDYFGTVSDVSWYQSAYVLAVCVSIPSVGRLYTFFALKYVYLGFMVIFEVGSLICALSRSSSVFIIGRIVNGIGSAGLLGGALMVIFVACSPDIRPLINSTAMALIPLGSVSGPLIAGVLTTEVTWRWCFWIFLPIGGVTMLITLSLPIPEQSAKLPFRNALANLHKILDPVGFAIFASATSLFLLAITWGGAKFAWSSPTIIGLLCGSIGLAAVFALWIRHREDDALIPPSSIGCRQVYVGSIIMYLQGGTTQMIPYFLPFWFQAIRGDSPIESAVHMLPSLVSNVVGLVVFGALVRRLRYIPPWAMAGGTLACVGAGLLSTFSPDTSTATWIGYQVVVSVGRGMSFQVPVVNVQETVPAAENAIALAIVNLSMSLGSAVAVSASQTIFRNRLPALLARYAPNVDVSSVIQAGATQMRSFVSAEQLPGLLLAYNGALTDMFYFSAACSGLAVFASLGLGWGRIGVKNPAESL